MPIVLIPIHFDRSNIERTTSFQRSVVIRPFITEDFMTGVPAIPGKDISLEVNARIFCASNHKPITDSIRLPNKNIEENNFVY